MMMIVVVLVVVMVVTTNNVIIADNVKTTDNVNHLTDGVNIIKLIK